MRIVTWNLQVGRAAAVWPRLVTALSADVVLLQETQRPEWPGSLAWKNVPQREWGSAVLVAAGTIREIPLNGYEGWVVGGEWVGGPPSPSERPRYVFSVHAPTKTQEQPRDNYVAETMSVLDMIEKQVPGNADLILGGDFNFVSLGNRRADESRKTTAQEREALARFARLGLVSCWTEAHPNCALPQTLRWSGDATPDKSTPYHCDGIFVPASWQPHIISEVLTSACFRASDHYPVVAWITK